MQWRDIQFEPTRKTLRQFAAIWILFFGAIAVTAATVRHRPEVAWAALALGMVVGLLGLVRPAAIKWVFVTWSVLAFPIGWLVSWVALGILFYAVFTPVAMVLRFAGRDELAIRRGRNQVSYWSRRSTPADPASYFRQT